jgi:hypothetical protein
MAQRIPLPFELLKVVSSRLPSFIRILLINRSVEDITTALQEQHILSRDLEVSSNVGSQDIVAYIQHHLRDIQYIEKIAAAARLARR